MTTQDRPLRIALASFAHVHAAGYASHLSAMPGVELLCADPDGRSAPGQPRGRELADQLGVAYVDSYEELLEWEPDGVVVCCENTRHGEIIEMAAAAGAWILCEKPLAVTRAEALRYEELARTAGVGLMVAYPVRFAPEFHDVRHALASGELGQVVSLAGTNNGKIPVGDRSWFTDPDLAGGGALVDHTVHVADLAQALLDAEPVRVQAFANRVLHADIPDVLTETGGLVQVEYADGTHLAIDCSWSQPLQAPVWGGLTLDVVTSATVASIAPFAHGVHGMSAQGSREVFLGYGEDLDALMLEEFLDSIRERRAPEPGPRSGVRTSTIVEAALRSASLDGAVIDCTTMEPVRG